MKATATVIGRLTRDVTSIFENENGSAKRALFTVACNSVYKKDNDKVKTVDYIPCIAWGPQADLLQKWGLKGRLLVINGTIETFQKPVKEDGSYDPVRVQVRVSQIEFLGFEDNVRDKLEANKAATEKAAPADTATLLAGLTALLAGATTTPAAPTPEQAQPSEDLAKALLELINKPVEQPNKTATPNAVAEEFDGLI